MVLNIVTSIKEKTKLLIARSKGHYKIFLDRHKRKFFLYLESIFMILFVFILLMTYFVANNIKINIVLLIFTAIAVYFIWQEIHAQLLSYAHAFKRN